MNMGKDKQHIYAVVNLPMLNWPTRTATNADFISPFKKVIREQFNENPDDYTKELYQFESLRNSAIGATHDLSGLKILKQYYCQLMAIMSRFKECEAKFSWSDIYGRNVTQGDLDFELNSVMFNIAAIHTELGKTTARTSEELTKIACTNFRSACWWVKELRDNRKGTKTKDMNRDTLTFFYHVLLAQAQECLFEKSLRDDMSPANIAKIVARIVDDYSSASILLQSSSFDHADSIRDVVRCGKIHEEWRGSVEFKVNYYKTLVYFLSGMACDPINNVGERIAWLQLASKKFEDATKAASGSPDQTSAKGTLTVLIESIEKHKTEAIRDNDYIYHSKVPTPDALSDIKGIQITEPLPFNMNSSTSEIVFKDIFSNLVPLEAHEVASLYSKSKDDLLRDVKRRVAEKDDELAQILSKLNLNKKNLKPKALEIPDKLIEICADISDEIRRRRVINQSGDIVDDVKNNLLDIKSKAETIHGKLKHAQELIQKRPQPAYLEELARYKSAHSKALQSNQSLDELLTEELKKVMKHLLEAREQPMLLLPEAVKTDEETLQKLEKLLDKIDEMKNQRTKLCDQLRVSIQEDDVIKQVLSTPAEQDIKKVFNVELKKHDQYLKPLENNLNLQDDILDTLERVNAQYASTKKAYKEYSINWETRLKTYLNSYRQFKELTEGIEKGLEYHTNMLNLVNNFHSRVCAAYEVVDFMN